MIKLIQLLKQYSNLILFIILFLFAMNLTAKRNGVQGVDIINSSNAWVGFWYKMQHDVVHYFQLKRMNTDLLDENARLKAELAQYITIDTFQSVVKTIPITAIDSAKMKADAIAAANDTTQKTEDSTIRKVGPTKIVRYAEYQYIPARVINNSISNYRMNYVTLNRGSNDGIRPNMSVVTANGIVGRVVNVSKNYSTVLSVLSEGRSYNAKLMDGTEELIHWVPGTARTVVMRKIPKLVDVQIGDSVWTTGHSLFPENVLIGTVQDIEIDKKTNTQNLSIVLSTDFRKLQFVYVVENELGKERAALEAQNEVE